jgi:hypothetical protein
MARLALLVLGLIGTLGSAALPTAAPRADTPTSADAITITNKLLAELTPVLNEGWGPLAAKLGLDPYQNVWMGGKVQLKCKYGGDEICGLQASSCEKMWAEIDVKTLTGISYLQFDQLAATSANVAIGNQVCPYESKADSGLHSASFSGDVNARASFKSGGRFVVDVSKIRVRVECNALGGLKKFKETAYSGSATCTGRVPKGSGTLKYCSGTCASGQVPANLGYTEVGDLDINVSDVSCNLKPDYNPASWIGEALVPAVESAIVNAVTPPIEHALNDLFAANLPYPGPCPK